jgi:filamentous hemagglutinin family protein
MKNYSLTSSSITATQIIRRRALYLAIMSILYPNFSTAAPSGAQVVSGKVSIDQSVSGITTIKNSPNAIINWQDFNIAKNEITQFIQQNGQSAVLNRIVGGNPSEILGSLYSNGKVFLINPNGIIFGAGSQIDTQGLLASTLNLSNSDFQKGNFHFIAGSNAGNISNEGIIHAGKDGNIVLIAPNIENNGIIKSEGGKIVLAAGQELILTSMDDPEIRFQVQAPKNSVLNVGQLLTEGGSINVFAGTLKHSGDISADSVEIDKQGNIRLIAKADITLDKDSKISANNDKGVAGKIEVTGENVAVLDNSKIEAVGEKGGGDILVGGDYQGKNAAVQNAQNTVVAEKVEIKADAKTDGKGGKVIVWSDNETKVAAKISAKGGKKSGDGGFVETSGKKLKIADTARISAKAEKGKNGTWLLDPNNFTIADIGGDMTPAQIEGDISDADITINTTTGGTSGGDGDIFVNSPIFWSLSYPSKLTLIAERNIEINAEINGGANGQLDLNAVSSITATAAVNVGKFNLINGGWSQIGATLPSFSATDFKITGGTFFRALGGGGVDINPYQITDIYGLQGMKGFLSSAFSLANDIDATGTSGWNSGAGFAPIGNDSNYSNYFRGKFDGLGHMITGLKINYPATNYVGLFGYAENAEIKNVGLVGGTVSGSYDVGGLLGGNHSGTVNNSYSTALISGDYNVGGLIGENYGSVSNSYSTSMVSGTGYVGGLLGYNDSSGSVVNSYSTGVVSGTGDYVGGLSGENKGAINNSYSSGNVSGTNYIGGLLGSTADGTISNSYSSGSVTGVEKIGGLIGAMNGTNPAITNSYSMGLVTSTTSSPYVGGLVGYNIDSSSNLVGTITNSYWNKDTSAQIASAGGAVGLTSSEMTGFTTDTSYSNQSYYPFLAWKGATLQTISGTATGLANKTFQYAVDGVFRGTFHSDSSDNFSLNSVVDTGNLLIWLSGDSSKAATVTDGTNVTGLSLSTNVLNVQNGSFSNSALGALKGSLSDGDIPYSVSGSSLASGIDFKVGQLANYNLDGAMTVSGGLANDGILEIGGSNTIGSSSITGNFTQSSSGKLKVELDGATHDALSITGNASLAGTLDAAFISSPPSVTTSYTFLTASGTTSGVFSLNTSEPALALAGNVLTYTMSSSCSLGYTICFIGGTNWNAGSNWSTGSLPLSTDDVEINGNYNVVLDVSAFVQSLNISGSSSLKVDTTSSNTLDTTNGISGTGTLIYKVSNIIPTTLPVMTIDNLTFSSDGDLTVNNALTFNGAGTLTFEYGQSSSTGGTSNYYINAPVNLQNATTFSTKLGSSGGNVDYSVITTLGNETGFDCAGGLQGIICSDNGNSGNYVLGGDIDASATSGWNSGAGFTPIGIQASPFTGKLDGLGHTVSNLTIYRPATNNVGLFGYSTGYISNLGIFNASVSALGATGVGAMVGWNNGQVQNSYSSGNMYAGGYVGGLIGGNDGTVKSSHSSADVYAPLSSSLGAAQGRSGGLIGLNTGIVDSSYATGNASAEYWIAGGLVGASDPGTNNVISNSYATGTATAPNFVGGLVGYLHSGTITSSYSTGLVVSTGSKGGLVGFIDTSGTITNSFWDVNTSGINTTIGDGTGLTTAEMTHAANFTGFDFISGSPVWSIQEGSSYPYLTSIPNIVNPTIPSGWLGSSCASGEVCFYPSDPNNLYSWNIALNWSSNSIPTTGSGLVRLSGFTGEVTYTDLTSAIDALTVDAGVTLTLSSTSSATALSISGLATIDGTLNVNNTASISVSSIAGNGSVNYNVSGDLTLPSISTSSLSVGAGGTITPNLVGTGTFELTSGSWIQNGTLPAFSATDFKLTGGTFIRALGGDGSIATPYQLTDVYGLQGVGTSLSSSFSLANDINASGTSVWNSGAGFAPIGDASTPFLGSFDGQNHTITGLMINRPTTNIVGNNVGLFGQINYATVQNLGLLNTSVSGNSQVGSLTGWSNHGTIINSYSTGIILGGGENVGGLLGLNAGTVINSYSTSAVTGQSNVGGLLGDNVNASVSNSYSTGAVTGFSATVGGLIGHNNNGTVSNSFWDKHTSGQTTSEGGTGLTTAKMTQAINFTGFDFTSGSPIWSIQEGQSYPYLTSNPLINRPSLLSWGGSNCVTGVCFYPTDTNNLYDWNTALNWNTNTIPDANSSVYLSGFTGTVYYTDLTSSIAALTIGAGIGLDLSSTGTATALNISGTSLINGSLNVNNSTFTPASGITGSGSINYDVTGDLALPLITANSVSVSASGNVTQTAPITATNLSLLGSGNYTLTNNNVIGTLAAGIASNKIGSLNFVNSGDLTIGSIDLGDSIFANGVTSTGEVSIATHNTGSNLTVNKPVSTTSTSLSAVKLNAGSIETTTTTGNIIFGTNGGISVGVGGRAELYSGSISGTTLPSGLIPAGNFRYNSDESVAHYTAPITAAGIYAIYREQPTLTVVPAVSPITYGDTLPSLTYSGMQNRDTETQIFGTTPTLTISSATSTSGNHVAGTHQITSGATDQLGYLVNYGSPLTINPKPLTVSGIVTASDKFFDESVNASLSGGSLTGVLSGDAIPILSGQFSDPYVGTAKPVAVSLTGNDAANYILSISPLTADINRTTNITWIGSTDNQWTNLSNWNQHVLPDVTQNVYIPSTPLLYIDIASNVSVNSLDSYSSLHLADSAALNVSQPFTVQQGTTLSGNGRINGNVTNSGALSPGNSPGSITIGGDFTQSSTGALNMEIASDASYDQLTVTGSATLGGTINFVSLGGYQSSPSFTPIFLSALGGSHGSFASVNNSPSLNYSVGPDGSFASNSLPGSSTGTGGTTVVPPVVEPPVVPPVVEPPVVPPVVEPPVVPPVVEPPVVPPVVEPPVVPPVVEPPVVPPVVEPPVVPPVVEPPVVPPVVEPPVVPPVVEPPVVPPVVEPPVVPPVVEPPVVPPVVEPPVEPPVVEPPVVPPVVEPPVEPPVVEPPVEPPVVEPPVVPPVVEPPVEPPVVEPPVVPPVVEPPVVPPEIEVIKSQPITAVISMLAIPNSNSSQSGNNNFSSLASNNTTEDKKKERGTVIVEASSKSSASKSEKPLGVCQ